MTERMLTWEGFLIPMLRAMEDGNIRSRREIPPIVADNLKLPDELRQVLISSGKPMYADRIGWAVSFLFRNGALERARRGHYVISHVGRQLISQFPNGSRKGDILALDQDP